jgi:hypothetical protein
MALAGHPRARSRCGAGFSLRGTSVPPASPLSPTEREGEPPQFGCGSAAIGEQRSPTFNGTVVSRDSSSAEPPTVVDMSQVVVNPSTASTPAIR